VATGAGGQSEARSEDATEPTIPDIDRLPAEACLAILAPLFEGAPRFLARLCAARPFGDEPGLFGAARRIASGMPEAEQIELIDAHPRLGAPAASVSATSFVEQGYDRAAAAADVTATGATADVAAPERARLAAELERLNDAYEARFGFRYCVFVAGRSRAALLPALTAALSADRDAEIARALDAVVDIAADRWTKLADRS
jgi:2-oxo-4-hydroxy-4-carboxy--5-ureidoimidazoline (OHCU) decarboxylase